MKKDLSFQYHKGTTNIANMQNKTALNEQKNTSSYFQTIGEQPSEQPVSDTPLIDKVQNMLLQGYPINAYPERLQKIILATNKDLNFNIEFISSSILYAASVAIGNNYELELSEGRKSHAALYMALIAPPSANKSEPLSYSLAPIQKNDALFYKDYLEKRKEYDSYLKLSKKEREDNGIEEQEEPFWKHKIISDFTIESLAKELKNNPKGLGVHCDELATWVNNFNRYSSGSEEQQWLSLWSRKPLTITRKNDVSLFIEMPFVSVAGTMQNEVLPSLASKQKSQNGFIDRLLFVIPTDVKKQYWSDTELNPQITIEYNNIITLLLGLEFENEGCKTLRLSSDAKRLILQWQRENTDICRGQDERLLEGFFGKLDLYVLRFALIFQLLFKVCESNRYNDNEISLQAAKSAIYLIEYFRNNAIKAFEIITNSGGLASLPENKRVFFEQLPKGVIFETKKAIEIGHSLGISTRTIKRFLKECSLFERKGQGLYKIEEDEE